jgi:hypothetical protein
LDFAQPTHSLFILSKLLTMTNHYEPFTPSLFKQLTGLEARDNEAVYLRWVNAQINHANFCYLQDMTESLREIVQYLREHTVVFDKK